jgi:molecular chaperone Hsp33
MSAPSNNPNNPNKWIKCISTHGNIRGVAIQAAGLINEIAQAHEIREDEHVRALGEAVMGALLVASYCKGNERINLNIQASGHIAQALVDAHPDGTVRGYVIGREEQQASTGLDSNDGPWGSGMLSVLRAKGGEAEQPYIGTVPLLTGHLAKDFSFYWVQSEQIPSAVGLAVNVEKGQVTTAGGFLVQALPGANPGEIKVIEQHINEIQSLAERLAEDADPLHLLSQIFQSTAFMLIEEKPLKFECNCSWERVQRALTLVGAAELKSMLTEDNAAVVRCDFCAKEYRVDADMLEELIDKARG